MRPPLPVPAGCWLKASRPRGPPGVTGRILARADSAYYGWAFVGTALRHRAWFSVTARMTPTVSAAITSIDTDAWMAIEYPNAVYDEDERRWVSDAEVAEVDFVAFTGRRKVRLGDGDRFVICHNPEAACHDAAVRANLVERLAEMIAGSDKLTTTKRAELRGVISTKPGLNRFLRTTPGGLLRIDAQAIKAEAKLDGKYLLRSNDPHLSAEDIALGYQQLLEVERGWRDMKQILDLRPVHHRLEDRIRAQVTLCWLALLLIRIAETTTGQTWNNLSRELQRLHVGYFTGPAGTYHQTTQATPAQRHILTQLDLAAPPRILALDTT